MYIRFTNSTKLLGDFMIKLDVTKLLNAPFMLCFGKYWNKNIVYHASLIYSVCGLRESYLILHGADRG